MIIFRYLAKEVLTTMLAVSTILLLIIVSGRFVKLLSEAARGAIDADVLFTVMAFMSLRFLELILPLGLFIGILLSYGRLYVDSEMTVLSACGMSERRIAFYTLVIAVPVALVAAGFSLYLAPAGYKKSQSLLTEQRNRTDFETMKPARFNKLDSGTGISYARDISNDKTQLNDVFIAEIEPIGSQPIVLVAQSAETYIDSQFDRKYLLLKDGIRYIGQPGDADYQVVEFDQFHQLLPQPDYSLPAGKETTGTPTVELFNNPDNEAQAALHWRMSVPVLVIIVAFLAIPLSRTQPRRGRYGKLLPSIMLFMAYVFFLETARGKLESGDAKVYLLWYVHLGFLVLGVLFFNLPHWINWMRQFFGKIEHQPQAVQDV